ncbi:MAG: SAM-dependent methyltransferase [Ilumatobacteraceae bacterium]
MSSAADELRAAIAAHGGPIPFHRFIEIALYGEHGFYATSGAAGRRGDFITSAEVGPLFGAVIARALDAWWREMGEPDDFTVVEAGAGPGTLARAILAAAPMCLEKGRYIAVEVSAAQRTHHPDGIESRATLPDGPINGVVLANELLDNLPFDLVVFDGAWREARVAVDRDRFVEVLTPLAEVPAYLPSKAPHGARAPIQTGVHRWLNEAMMLLGAGRMLLFDYCTPLTAQAAVSPWREWLRTYVGHERGGHYLLQPGGQDITNQVMIDQLSLVAEPESIRTQAQFLHLWGIDELIDEGRRAWEAAAARPDVAAMKMRSRISEADALLDPSGLGAFSALTYRTG